MWATVGYADLDEPSPRPVSGLERLGVRVATSWDETAGKTYPRELLQKVMEAVGSS